MLFLFFSILGEWGGWVLESMENSILEKTFVSRMIFRALGTKKIESDN